VAATFQIALDRTMELGLESTPGSVQADGDGIRRDAQDGRDLPMA